MKLEDVEFLLDRAFAERIVNVKESIQLSEEALIISKELGDEFCEAKARCQLGLLKMIIGENQEAERQSVLALDYFEKEGYKDWAASALYSLGSVHYKSSNYHQGLESLLKCLRYRREINDLAGESKVLKAIGYIYEVFNDTENAFSTYLKCREISKSIGDKAGESNALNPLSSLYLDRDDYVNALEVINDSIRLKKEIDDQRGLAFAYYGKGKIFLKSQEYSKAKEFFMKSLLIHRQVGEKLGTAMAEMKLAKWAIATEHYKDGEEHVKNALEVAQFIDNNELMFKCYYIRHQLAAKADDWKNALKYFQQYHEYKEKVLNTESIGKVKNIEVIMNSKALEREAALQKEKNAIIQQKNTELDTFVYRVSHDLKGPLSSLIGLRNVVLQDVNDETALSYFEFYHQQAHRLNDMVTGLIDLAQMKDKELTKTPVDFDQAVEQCISSFSYLPNFHTIHFDINIQPDIKFYSDKGSICTIIQNLIENAIKYSKPKRDNEVKIDIMSQSNTVLISVADNGIGISEALQPKVFDMFYRANQSQPGTGLGLYILKKAVERLGGKIKLESKRGIGTTFTISLPH